MQFYFVVFACFVFALKNYKVTHVLNRVIQIYDKYEIYIDMQKFY